MKKVLLYILCTLLLVSTAFAAHEVTISPANPTTNDDLTCLVDGQTNQDYDYTWYINNNLVEHPNLKVQKETYILDKSYLKTGDTIKCEVIVHTPWDSHIIGTAEVVINGTSQSKTHKITILPSEPKDNDDLTCLIDDQKISPQTSNYAYVWLINNINVENPNLNENKETEILSNENTRPDDIARCEVYVITPWDMSPLGFAEVKILPNEQKTNNAPILNLPNIEFYSGKSVTINLDNYVTDDYTSDDKITWKYTQGINTNVQVDSNRNAVFTSKQGFTGTEILTFTATDEQGLSTNQKITVTVKTDWSIKNWCLGPTCGLDWTDILSAFPFVDIPFVNSNPKVKIIEPETESKFDLNLKVIKFVAEFSDPNNDRVNITWNFGDGTHTTKQEDNIIKSSLATIYHSFEKPGNYTITVTATDENGGKDSDRIVIHILEQNIQPKTPEIIDDNDKPKTSSGICKGNEFDIVHIMPLNYQEIYKTGDIINLLVKIKNNGCNTEKLTIRFYNINGNELYQLPNLYVDSIESQTVEYNFKVPQTKGTQLLKVIVSEGDKSLIKYFQYTVA
jgi:hypothetical protein